LHAAEDGGDQVELEQPDQAQLSPPTIVRTAAAALSFLMDPSFCLEFV
jgi:hypothetical protein